VWLNEQMFGIMRGRVCVDESSFCLWEEKGRTSVFCSLTSTTLRLLHFLMLLKELRLAQVIWF